MSTHDFFPPSEFRCTGGVHIHRAYTFYYYYISSCLLCIYMYDSFSFRALKVCSVPPESDVFSNVAMHLAGQLYYTHAIIFLDYRYMFKAGRSLFSEGEIVYIGFEQLYFLFFNSILIRPSSIGIAI